MTFETGTSCGSVTAAGQDAATWRVELAVLLTGYRFPVRIHDGISQFHRLRAPSRLLWRRDGVPANTKFNFLDALVAQLDTRSAAVGKRLTANRSEAIASAASQACDTVLPVTG